MNHKLTSRSTKFQFLAMLLLANNIAFAGIGSTISNSFVGMANELTVAAIGIATLITVAVGVKMWFDSKPVMPMIYRIMGGGLLIAFATQIAKFALGGGSTGFGN